MTDPIDMPPGMSSPLQSPVFNGYVPAGGGGGNHPGGTGNAWYDVYGWAARVVKYDINNQRTRNNLPPLQQFALDASGSRIAGFLRDWNFSGLNSYLTRLTGTNYQASSRGNLQRAIQDSNASNIWNMSRRDLNNILQMPDVARDREKVHALTTAWTTLQPLKRMDTRVINLTTSHFLGGRTVPLTSWKAMAVSTRNSIVRNMNKKGWNLSTKGGVVRKVRRPRRR